MFALRGAAAKYIAAAQKVHPRFFEKAGRKNMQSNRNGKQNRRQKRARFFTFSPQTVPKRVFENVFEASSFFHFCAKSPPRHAFEKTKTQKLALSKRSKKALLARHFFDRGMGFQLAEAAFSLADFDRFGRRKWQFAGRKNCRRRPMAVPRA